MSSPYKRERFVRSREIAPLFARKYFERFPIDRYETKVESVRALPPNEIEFIMKRLRWPNL